VSYELAKNPKLASKSILERFEPSLATAREAIASGAARDKLVEWSAASQQF
jgi:hypothetical protein